MTYAVRWWLHERLYDIGSFFTRLAMRVDPRVWDFSYLAEDDSEDARPPSGEQR